MLPKPFFLLEVHIPWVNQWINSVTWPFSNYLPQTCSTSCCMNSLWEPIAAGWASKGGLSLQASFRITFHLIYGFFPCVRYKQERKKSTHLNWSLCCLKKATSKNSTLGYWFDWCSISLLYGVNSTREGASLYLLCTPEGGFLFPPSYMGLDCRHGSPPGSSIWWHPAVSLHGSLILHQHWILVCAFTDSVILTRRTRGPSETWLQWHQICTIIYSWAWAVRFFCSISNRFFSTWLHFE